MNVRFASLTICLGLLAGGASASPGARAASAGCLKCHGDAGVMKALVKPPVEMSGEGEG
ncbi:MAG: hypothetical protein ACYDA8_23665 [Deferrisomatales bacterium]